ncbi:putative tail protein [Roseicyclus mahoneyensis]|uniref:Putative tail protein n=1 Tax=Roseicyclus mahoneyensis TaxID=164332 RepID=A0A316GNE3_9RHOB|nr:glycoside hydrolase TIM-barrel-like domain-containing protein [Roseicyclus mahoneyensis]PWK62168.1 putative tail protein [Roseicyclus mahoneyensis]
MATLLLSAAGAAIGGMASGTVLGLTGAVIGRAVGATLGRVIDQRLLGSGSDAVERGRIDRFRITQAGEGAPVAQLFGRMRLGGQVIWATQFVERAATSGGGKGAPPQPKTTTYSYSVSLAVALCEGEIRRVGRVWADGVELDLSTLSMRVYTGAEDQMPDPLLEAVEGAGAVPAYRGIAYVVFEDLDLTPFGNRVPQFAFEVARMPQPERDMVPAAADLVRAVALMPGTGEYVLSTRSISYRKAFGIDAAFNTSAAGGGSDFTRSLQQMRDVLPGLRSVSLIYSWFGDDLRAGSCTVKPKVEDKTRDGAEMPWRAGGITRAEAEELARIDDRPVYGGTPADGSVIEAIEAIRAGGQEVMVYPFLLMEILAANGLPDPWGGAEQPPLPWRGRITGDLAPGQPGSPDGSAANGAAVDAFFGTVTAADFTVANGLVTYSGPQEWSYSRFILHSAALCAAAGGVDAFCIGSEMRSLTQMRDHEGFRAVTRLRQLAAEVRALLPEADLGYAADWSEYFGYQPQDGSGDVYFHLDPLWADDEIDFIGIDNYMPLSDWRDGTEHADAAWGTIYDQGYLEANIEGGEGYDWYYPTEEARAAQRRVLIDPGLRGWQVSPPEESVPPGPTTPYSVDVRASVAVFRGIVRLPATPVDGALWEAGGAGTGSWLGVRDGGTVLRLRAGDGQTAKTGSDLETAVLDLPVAGLPFDDRLHEVMWDLHPAAPGRVRLWIDGVLRGSAETSAGGPLRSGWWAGGDAGGWLQIAASVTVGEPVTAWPAVDGAGLLSRSRAIFPPPGLVDAFLYRYKDIAGWWASAHHDRLGGVPLALPSPWVPRSKPVRFTEIGCPAVDKGTNEPNKFFDPKSSESALPRYSDGRRDDLIQAQYLRAIMSYWDAPGRNPVSDVYGGPMLQMDYAHVWAWDARPWPAFPNDIDRWSDGGNWRLGHWITGRIEAVPLSHVVAELCEAAGVSDYDVTRLQGLVRGHLSGETESARARLQTLMLAYGFQAVEREGTLVFLPLPVLPAAVIDADATAVAEDGAGGITEIRAAEAEIVGRVRLSYTAAEADYQDRVAEAVFPADGADAVTASDLPLALTGPEGQAVAERWLAEARVARDVLRLFLPPSLRALGAGDMVALPDGSTWRIDRVEDRGARNLEAVRVEPSVSDPSEAVEEFAPASSFVPPVPVTPVFLDLPLLSGSEVEHAPHLAVTATPWPGTVAVYTAAGPDGFTLNRLMERRAVIGMLETPLVAARPGLWDRAGALRVRLASGQLSAAEMAAVLNGANLAAIGSGDDGAWEVIQFAQATLVGEGLWDIAMRLRGQQGTDGVMPEVWPEGSLFVLLDGGPGQVDLGPASRGLARHYRVGSARRSVDDPSYVEKVLAFQGVGLRPYAPAHLRAQSLVGSLTLSWIRRSRIDGDSWEGVEVPLGETAEAYLLRVVDATGLRREVTLGAPGFTYTGAMRASDGTTAPFTIEVAQMSDRFGPGPFARIMIDD